MRVFAVFSSALCACAVAMPAWGSEPTRDLPNVIVVGEPVADPTTLVTVPQGEPRGLAADGGDLLRGLLGVSASRMGGHGLEPVIRGQAQGRLNVLLDGAYIYGGCPNRMDPPSSFAALSAYDRITVIKGVQTLIHGAGGSGGTVLFERDTRVPEAGFGADLDVAGSDNDTDYAASADLVAGSVSWYARSILQQEDWNNYQDGNGDTVRSAFEQRSASLILGATPRANELFELSVEASRVDDALYAGAGMDAPKDNTDTFRLRYEGGGFAGLLRFEHDMADARATVFTGLSRTLRSADTTERYIAANNPMDPTRRWIGNPALDPEKHYQADVGVAADIGGGRLTAVVFYDWVEDYILRGTARGQDGIPEADLANVYRNVDARLAGAELELDWWLGEHIALRANAAYVRAENEDDDQPIAQTPPLNGVLEAAYQRA